jgi:aspartate/methionine/tyrosine aminotransferase
MRPRPSSRTAGLSESVIRMMTRLAEKHGALNLAQGFPDFPAPSDIKAAAVGAIMNDENQYATTWGSATLRDAVASKAAWFNHMKVDPEKEVTVTCGSTEALMATVMALSEPGDEVIVIEPFYENYVPSAVLAGARPRFVPLGPGLRLDEERLKESFNAKTKLVILNTPHNPTGKVMTKEELRVVADLCSDRGVFAVTDEIYEHIVYDGREHVSLATLGDMAQRTVTISGISKTYTVTGWRIGYAIAEPEVTNAVRKVHDYMTVCAPAPFQEAASYALHMKRSFYKDLARSYQRKRDIITKGLRDLGFTFFQPEGAYYVLADFGGLSKGDDSKFATSMTVDCGVAVVPGSSFYRRGRGRRKSVRFSYSKRDSTLRDALSLMRKHFG